MNQFVLVLTCTFATLHWTKNNHYSYRNVHNTTLIVKLVCETVFYKTVHSFLSTYYVTKMIHTVVPDKIYIYTVDK